MGLRGPGSNQHADKPARPRPVVPTSGNVATVDPAAAPFQPQPRPVPVSSHQGGAGFVKRPADPPVDPGPAKMMRSNYAVAGGVAGRRHHVLATVKPGDQVLFVPEPENPHDPYAVAVWAEHGKAGYLPKPLAVRCRLLGPTTGTVTDVRHAPDDPGKTPTGLGIDASLPMTRRIDDGDADALRTWKAQQLAEQAG